MAALAARWKKRGLDPRLAERRLQVMRSEIHQIRRGAFRDSRSRREQLARFRGASERAVSRGRISEERAAQVLARHEEFLKRKFDSAPPRR